ncbi:hypothetical protein EAF00_007580 [Botryotinia globosa]|nr:hypothetical protein EAF00_007580 [Botryotinia globosa]
MDPAIPIMGYILLSIFLILLLLLISFFLICKYQIYTETQKSRGRLSSQAQGANASESSIRIPLRRGGIGRRGKGLRGVLPLRRGGMGCCEAGKRVEGGVVGEVERGERIDSDGERNGMDEVDVVDGEVEILGAPPPYLGRGEVRGIDYGMGA